MIVTNVADGDMHLAVQAGQVHGARVPDVDTPDVQVAEYVTATDVPDWTAPDPAAWTSEGGVTFTNIAGGNATVGVRVDNIYGDLNITF